MGVLERINRAAREASGGTLALPADVPIVGQPAQPGVVEGWWPTLLIKCGCGFDGRVAIVGAGIVGHCNGCGRGFRLDGLVLANGETSFTLSIVVKQQDTPAVVTP